MTNFDSNTFENDYIVAVLQHMATDLKTQKPVEQIIDKYAVELTAFMNGRIRAIVRSDRVDAEILEGIWLLVRKKCTETRLVTEWIERNRL